MVYEVSGDSGYAMDQRQLSSSHVVCWMSAVWTSYVPKAGLLHQNWAIFTFCSTGKAGLIPWRSPEVPQGGRLAVCTGSVTSESRHPTLKTCHGSKPRLGQGRWVQRRPLLHPPGVRWQACQAEQSCSGTCLGMWQGMALEIREVVYHLQTIFYRGQTRSQLYLRNYNGKENWWHLIQYLWWSSVSLFSVVNYICLRRHGKRSVV